MINQGSELYKLTTALSKKRGMQPKEFLQQLLLEEYRRLFKRSIWHESSTHTLIPRIALELKQYGI